MNPQFNQAKGSTVFYLNKKMVARAANVNENAVIFSSDKASVLDNKTIIFDDVAQKIWGKPSGIPNGAKIVSISGSNLTYSPGNVVVSLVNPPNLAVDKLINDLQTVGSISIPANNIILKASAPAASDVPLNVFAKQYVSLLQFPGVVADGVTDTRGAVQTAIDACAAAKINLYVPAGVYAFANWFSLPSNSRIEFDELAWFKLLNNTTFPDKATGMGGFLMMGYQYNNFYDTDGVTPKQIEATDIVTIGMKLDINGIAGENGLCGLYCNNIRHIRPVIKGTRHTQAKLGGRAFQFEGNVVQNVVISNATVLDCSIGCNSQALAGSTSHITKALVYDGLFMNNVDVPFNIDGQAANPDTADATIHSVTVYNAVLHNCGAPRSGFGTNLGGGIVCGDRGAGLAIYGFRLINDTEYGGIGAIVRGQIFNVQISDADINAPYIVSIVDHNPPGYGNPSGASFNAFCVLRNVRVSANLDYIGRSFGTSVGPHSWELDIDMTKASVANLFDNNIAGSSALAANAMLKLTNSLTGFSTGWRSFRDLFLAGNTPALCIKRKDGVGTFSPLDASGLSATLTATGTQKYMRDGETVTVWLNVTYPTTTDTRAAVISGLPFTGLSELTYAGICPVLNGGGVGSFAVVRGGEGLIRFFTPTGTNVTNADLSGKNIALVLRYAV